MEGFTGVGNSIEHCLYKAKWGMEEHVAFLRDQGFPVSPPVPAHLFSAEEWAGLFCQAGFRDVSHRRIADRSPTPDVYAGRWFRDAEQMRNFKREGALLLHGARPLPR